jgi:hypothetical protein
MTHARTTLRMLTPALLLLLVAALAPVCALSDVDCAEDSHTLHASLPRLVTRLFRRLSARLVSFRPSLAAPALVPAEARLADSLSFAPPGLPLLI